MFEFELKLKKAVVPFKKFKFFNDFKRKFHIMIVRTSFLRIRLPQTQSISKFRTSRLLHQSAHVSDLLTFPPVNSFDSHFS